MEKCEHCGLFKERRDNWYKYADGVYTFKRFVYPKEGAVLTCEKLLEAYDVFMTPEKIPPRDSNEALMDRIVHCHGETIAIVRAFGYVYCFDGLTLRQYLSANRNVLEYMVEYINGQLREQGLEID